MSSPASHGTPFFLSYARAGHDAAAAVRPYGKSDIEKFYFDLSENIYQLIPLAVGADPGFMDTDIRSGTRWTEELLEAVGTCQVLVALLSPRYLASDWCGEEWNAFSRRSVRRLAVSRASKQGCIVPVIWTPVPDLSKFGPTDMHQIFYPVADPDPDLPGKYRTNGIFGLLRARQEDSYQIIVWQLAKLIASLYSNQLATFRRFRPEELHSTFPGSQP